MASYYDGSTYIAAWSDKACTRLSDDRHGDRSVALGLLLGGLVTFLLYAVGGALLGATWLIIVGAVMFLLSLVPAVIALDNPRRATKIALWMIVGLWGLVLVLHFANRKAQ